MDPDSPSFASGSYAKNLSPMTASGSDPTLGEPHDAWDYIIPRYQIQVLDLELS